MNHNSLLQVLSALLTITDGTTHTLKLELNINKLTDAEKAIATDKGWTIV